MKRKILWLVGIVVLLVIIVLATIPLWIDGVAREVVQIAGTETLKVETKVDSIRLGLLSGTCTIKGLEVGNPPGFKQPHFMKLGEGHVNVSLGTVMDKEVILPELVFDGMSVNLERIGTKTNYGTIIDNIETAEKKEPETGGTEQKFVVKDLVIRDVNVIYNVSLVGAVKPGVPLHIKEIRMKDVGSDGDGVTMGKMISIIIQGILDTIGKAGKGVLPDDVTGGISKGLKGLGNAGKGLVEGVGGLFGGKK